MYFSTLRSWMNFFFAVSNLVFSLWEIFVRKWLNLLQLWGTWVCGSTHRRYPISPSKCFPVESWRGHAFGECFMSSIVCRRGVTAYLRRHRPQGVGCGKVDWKCCKKSDISRWVICEEESYSIFFAPVMRDMDAWICALQGILSVVALIPWIGSCCLFWPHFQPAYYRLLWRLVLGDSCGGVNGWGLICMRPDANYYCLIPPACSLPWAGGCRWWRWRVGSRRSITWRDYGKLLKSLQVGYWLRWYMCVGVGLDLT